MMNRFEQKIDKSGDCWIWTGNKSKNGYGRFAFDNRNALAHRVSYALYVGRIPDGMFVCHSCDVKACVNPEHLWLGTNSDNQKDSVAKGLHHETRKTHCPQGHEYTIENTQQNLGAGQGRACKECNKARCKEYHNRKKVMK